MCPLTEVQGSSQKNVVVVGEKDLLRRPIVFGIPARLSIVECHPFEDTYE